jgi:hypothetical membrane protein
MMSSEGTGRQVETQSETTSLVQWAGVIGVAGPVMFWVVSLGLGFMWSEYSPVHNFVSSLSAIGAPYAFVAQLNLYFWGASIIVLALGLHTWSRRGRRPWVGVLLLAVVGIGVVLAGFFQYNPDNLAATSTRGHQIATRVMSIATLLGIPLTTWRLNRDERWSGYQHRFLPVGITVLLLVAFVTQMISIPTGPTGWAGLGQRIFFAVVTGWLAYYGFMLYRLTRSGSSAP